MTLLRRNHPVVDAFVHELDVHLKDRFEYKSTNIHSSDARVSASRSRYDLYVRLLTPDTASAEQLRAWESNSAIVIARIGFARKIAGDWQEDMGSGHGTALLNLCTRFADQHGFESIAIECAFTPSIQAFARKHGFREVRGSSFLARVSELKATLSADA